MTDCNLEPIRFPSCKGRLVEVSFSGGAITPGGGAVLPRQADRMPGLTDRAARSPTDTRPPGPNLQTGYFYFSTFGYFSPSIDMKGAPQWLCDRVCRARGDMENRIKEQQLDLFADRAGCRAWWPNQYRLPLSAMAYVLLEAIRRIALAGGELANAHVGTIRLKLLKIGAVVLRNTRGIRLPLSGSCPRRELFHTAAARLQPG